VNGIGRCERPWNARCIHALQGIRHLLHHELYNSEPLGCKAVNVPLSDLHAIGHQVTQMHSLISFDATAIKSDTLPGLFMPQTKHEKLSQVMHKIFIEEYGSPC
jgi:hypothetical protein